ncbi:hypothetical protein GCM10010434_077960 [Winogradskya humida]
MALLLDLANILGGLLLAVPLLTRLPSVGDGFGRFAAKIAPWGWIVGIVALVAGGYYLIVHVFSGPHVFHFEIVGIAVGVLLLWDRLTGRKPLGTGERGGVAGAQLLLAIFGIIAILVGIQGLFTSD